MFSESKFFLTAFILSLGMHGFILAQHPNFYLAARYKTEKAIAINYVKIKEPKTTVQPAVEQKIERKRPVSASNSATEPLKNISGQVTMKKLPPPPQFFDRQALGSRPEFIKPNFSKPDISAIKKKISLPPMDTGKINNPSYINYYQMVREKIRKAAYQNYGRTETGEAYISFIIATNGELKDIQFIEERSSKNNYLKDIAIRSVRNAAPFSQFPKELDYPQLSFNVIISFEIE